MKIFNQQDYPNEYLGNSTYSIGRWGCLATVITMIFDHIYNKDKDPVEISKRLEFTADGLFIWSSLKNIGLKLDSRVRYFNKEEIDKAYKSDNQYIALQVNNNHWVWVIGRYVPYLGYRIADPLHGDRAYTNRYKLITGYALISKIDEIECTHCCPKHCVIQ